MPTERDLLYESLYKQYFGRLKAIAYSQLRNGPIAEEVVQDVFVTALDDQEAFLQSENHFAYLSSALYYKVKEQSRARRRYARLFFQMDQERMAEIKAPSNAAPVSTFTILETARNALTDEEWYILWKFAIQGAPHLQIAKELGITVPASQKRLERIRKKLEDVLPEH